MTNEAKDRAASERARSAGWIVAVAWCVTALVVAVALPWIARTELQRLSLVASSYLEEGELRNDDRFQKILIAQGEVHRQLARFQLELDQTLERESEAREQVTRLEDALSKRQVRHEETRSQLRRLQAKLAQSNLAATRDAPTSTEPPTDAATTLTSPAVEGDAASEIGDSVSAAPSAGLEPGTRVVGGDGLSAEALQSEALQGLIGRLPPELQAAATQDLLNGPGKKPAATGESQPAEQARRNLNRLLEDSGALFRFLEVESVEPGVLANVSASVVNRRGLPIGSVVARRCHLTIDVDEKIADFRFEEGTVVEDGLRQEIDPFHWIRVVDIAPAAWTAIGPRYDVTVAPATEPAPTTTTALPVIVPGLAGSELTQINKWLLGSGERAHYQFASVGTVGAGELGDVELIRRDAKESILQRLEARRCVVTLLAGQRMVQLDLYEGRILPTNGSPQTITPTGFRLIVSDIDEVRWRALEVEWLQVLEPPVEDRG